jgi:hypothetical protein
VDWPLPGGAAPNNSEGTAQMLLDELGEQPGAAGAQAPAREFGPNWFAVVMGTGIVAVAGAELPLRVPGLRVFATVVWGLASVMLPGLTAAWAGHWARHPAQARGHAADPVMAQFWGAPRTCWPPRTRPARPWPPCSTVSRCGASP